MPRDNDKQALYDFSRRLVQWQRSLGISGRTICRTIKITESLWYRYTAGQHFPKIQNLAALAAYYPIDLHYLLTGKAAPGRQEVGQKEPKLAPRVPNDGTVWQR